MNTYTLEEINDWLFNRNINPKFPKSQLYKREQEKYKPIISVDEIEPTVKGKYQNDILIHQGGVTDIKIPEGKTGAVCTSNNGDLLTGCGYEIATAVVNAAGAGLQTELYNKYGVTRAESTPASKGNGDNGRGYAITCDSYDMKQSHNIDKIELLAVPMRKEAGVVNMYYEAFKHSKDLDYIIVPTAGMTHPVLKNSYIKSAKLTMQAFLKFQTEYPDSNLKVIFTLCYPEIIAAYEKYVNVEDNISLEAINRQEDLIIGNKESLLGKKSFSTKNFEVELNLQKKQKVEDVTNVADQSKLKSLDALIDASQIQPEKPLAGENQIDNVEILADVSQIDSSTHN